MAAPRSTLIWIGGVALGLGVAVLPWWDASAAMHEGRPAFVAATMGAVLCASFATAFVRGSWGGRWLALALAAAAFLIHAAWSTGATMLERSRIADTWPTCETGFVPSGIQPIVPAHTTIEGPRLKSGEPCAPVSEGRELHRRQWPRGDLGDGFRQVIGRFPGDLPRMLIPPMLATFLLALAGVLLAKAGAQFG